MQDPFEREEDELCRQVNNGEITSREFNSAMRELLSDHQAMAEEAGQEAYNQEMDRW